MRQGLAEQARQSTALPVEIGFLADYGLSPDTLRDAAMIAELTGVTADAALLKHGLVEELLFYRALAAELRLPFLTAPRLSPGARYPESLLTGLAPLADGSGFVMAPQGEILARLLKGGRPARALAIPADEIPPAVSKSSDRPSRGSRPASCGPQPVQLQRREHSPDHHSRPRRTACVVLHRRASRHDPRRALFAHEPTVSLHCRITIGVFGSQQSRASKPSPSSSA